ncbi:hypothetical protein [Aurantimonas sp. VKM B-3413]|uniref:hypothetical protein n=1 Tax=Aurantimonas sp. VKM B-3413 TaxID=2779401 RepID=UPI001E3A9A66|nr:hypothetical protein [Aurantimonas sp. VKM B-3413]MCB8836569.1 hypothetical protein [Aurantimonas sp. VKM B-3413]
MSDESSSKTIVPGQSPDGEPRAEAVTDEPPEHPVEAWRETSRVAAASRTAPVPEGPKGAAEDPLAAKHKATRFDRDFRTLDYANLSRDEAERETERRRRTRQHSSWHPAKPGSKRCEPVKEAQFSPFGGSTISAEVIRGRSDRAPDMMPTLPGEGSPSGPQQEAGRGASSRRSETGRHAISAPNPDGPTPSRDARKGLPSDPLAEKHKAERFDKDFRTLDYRRLNASKTGAEQSKPSGTAGDPQADGPPAGEPAAASFRVSGVSGPVIGAPQTADEGGAGRSGDAASGGPEREAREPQRRDHPRGGTPDDLTRIAGIGPAIERLLHDLGIFHYDQIAALGEAEARWLDDKLGFSGRIAEERWVDQAKTLEAEGRADRTS